MVADAVSVLDLRNLAAAEVALGPGLNLLWGPNGAGKTNLLEAAFMALAGRSCRTRDVRETIAFGKPLARVQAMIADDGRRLDFLFSVSRSDGRRHHVDGEPATAESAARRPSLAVFMPDRLALVKGPPSGRRAHLDSFCAALWPARAETRRRYARALAQRNALLGRIRAGTGSRPSLDAWDLELAESGVGLITDRAQACERLGSAFEAAAEALGLAGEPTLRYRPRSEAEDPAQLAVELGERRDSDLARGFTGWGPHLDELALEAGGRSLRRYGSQGQQRTALLALLFAERRALLDAGLPPPLMLLDDVASELDGDHRELLVELLATGGGQALITATDLGQLPGSVARREIAVRAGRVLAPTTNELVA
jgi:DNA replication and repair protein RecF